MNIIFFFYLKVLFDTTHALLSFIVQKKPEKIKIFDLSEQSTSANKTEDVYKIQCFPLYSILLAIGKTKIDYFGLDVEGSEYKILKTIPWHKVDIQVLILLTIYIFFSLYTYLCSSLVDIILKTNYNNFVM
jgi:hypothetical protein